MMKEILSTEAIPFTITQISCYISAGAEVMGRAGLTGGVKRIRKTIGTTTVCTKKGRNMRSAVRLHPPEPGSRDCVSRYASSVRRHFRTKSPSRSFYMTSHIARYYTRLTDH
jgi:hypothetical protein